MEVQCGQPLPNILQLNVEDLNANKICIISQLATKHKALIILLQETNCTSVDCLVIQSFTLVRHTLSKKHGLSTFVHSRLKWNVADQPPTGSAIEWLCADIDGVKVVNVYKPNWGYNSTSPD